MAVVVVVVAAVVVAVVVCCGFRCVVVVLNVRTKRASVYKEVLMNFASSSLPACRPFVKGVHEEEEQGGAGERGGKGGRRETCWPVCSACSEPAKSTSWCRGDGRRVCS